MSLKSKQRNKINFVEGGKKLRLFQTKIKNKQVTFKKLCKIWEGKKIQKEDKNQKLTSFVNGPAAFFTHF